MLRTGYYVKRMKSIRFFNPSSVIYMRAQVNSTTIANICWLIQIFKYQFCGFQVHFESNMVYNVKTKSDFCSKCPHYIMDYIMNLGAMFFLVSLVWNLAYIDYSLCHIWSVYMQYLQCCDHFKKWFFLVVQKAEVSLNFFWWVYFWFYTLLFRRRLVTDWWLYINRPSPEVMLAILLFSEPPYYYQQKHLNSNYFVINFVEKCYCILCNKHLLFLHLFWNTKCPCMSYSWPSIKKSKDSSSLLLFMSAFY